MFFGDDDHSYEEKTCPDYLHHRKRFVQEYGGKQYGDGRVDIIHQA